MSDKKTKAFDGDDTNPGILVSLDELIKQAKEARGRDDAALDRDVKVVVENIDTLDKPG
jgi:hypothetical protein